MITSQDVHSVMVEKGFWNPDSIPLDFLQARTYMQLVHILDEWFEMTTAQYNDRLEEAADVVIVALDLEGAHGVKIDLEILGPSAVEYSIPDLVAGLGHNYRKTGRLFESDLNAIIMTLFRRFGKAKLVAAVKEKMEKNKERPALYGVAQA